MTMNIFYQLSFRKELAEEPEGGSKEKVERERRVIRSLEHQEEEEEQEVEEDGERRRT